MTIDPVESARCMLMTLASASDERATIIQECADNILTIAQNLRKEATQLREAASKLEPLECKS